MIISTTKRCASGGANPLRTEDSNISAVPFQLSEQLSNSCLSHILHVLLYYSDMYYTQRLYTWKETVTKHPALNDL